MPYLHISEFSQIKWQQNTEGTIARARIARSQPSLKCLTTQGVLVKLATTVITVIVEFGISQVKFMAGLNHRWTRHLRDRRLEHS